MQEGNHTKNNILKADYPYLSIDQLKNHHQKYTDLKGEVSDFFNIKFDQKYQHKHVRNHQQKLNSAQKDHPDASTISSKPEIFPKIAETSSESSKLVYQQNLKKRLDTQKMLKNLQKLITRQKSFDLKYHLVPTQKKKHKKKKESKSGKNTDNAIENILCVENIEQKTAAEKSKTIPFPQMLKKCSKLKEILRYEHQLISEKVLTSEGIAIRFYTEPFSSIEPKEDSFYQDNKFKIRPSVKKSVQTKVSQFFQNSSIQPLKEDKKTLDIRKYTNHSVMKQRSKFAAKKQLMRQQRSKEQREARRSEPVKQKKDDYQMVTPWDEIDAKYDLQLH